MREKVTSKLMETGWAASDAAPVQAAQFQPLARGVYASGVYKANFNALFGDK